MAGLHHDFSMICRARGIDVLVDEPQPWLTRQGHLNPLVQATAPQDVLEALATIFRALDGDEARLSRNRGGNPSAPDLVHAGTGILVEIDELPHFTGRRARTFGSYPVDTPLAFDLDDYRALIERHHVAAEAILAREDAKEFPFPGGRQAQRAYGDALRDLLAPVFTGHPVIRVAVPEQSLTGVVQVVEARLSEQG